MLTVMIFVFLIGYLCIALEHPLKVNKAGTALLTGTILWVLYTFAAPDLIPTASAEEFKEFLDAYPAIADLPFVEQCTRFVVEHQVLDSIGEIAETLIFLIGAMITVELIDAHGGFMFITNRIKTGAWSPIGDVTTIMLWVRGNISSSSTIPHLILPSLVSMIVPVLIMMRFLHGKVTPPDAFTYNENDKLLKELRTKEKLSILILGVLCLIFVPIFKTITHLPPFMGILMGVGILWIYTELMYKRNIVNEDLKLRLSKIVRRIDGATLLFFLGILLAVDALRCSGVLTDFAFWLDETVGNVYAVNLIIGTLSAVVDNVPLVAGAIGMYPVATDAIIATATDPTYMANFVQDGIFWQFLAYCAGVGGSMLIIGSAAGVVVMGLERINFIWYLKNISLLALIGYLAGAGVYILQNVVLGL